MINAFWLYVHCKMAAAGYKGPFSNYASWADESYQLLSDSSKQRWKDRAIALRSSPVGIEFKHYDRLLKKEHDQEVTKNLLKERHTRVQKMIAMCSDLILC